MYPSLDTADINHTTFKKTLPPSEEYDSPDTE